jgi:hypothetical protein
VLRRISFLSKINSTFAGLALLIPHIGNDMDRIAAKGKSEVQKEELVFIFIN